MRRSHVDPAHRPGVARCARARHRRRHVPRRPDGGTDPGPGAGAARIGSGDLGQRIAIKTGDEVEALADQFNEMAGRLKESYANLEKRSKTAPANCASCRISRRRHLKRRRVMFSSSPGELMPVFEAASEKWWCTSAELDLAIWRCSTETRCVLWRCNAACVEDTGRSGPADRILSVRFRAFSLSGRRM